MLKLLFLEQLWLLLVSPASIFITPFLSIHLTSAVLVGILLPLTMKYLAIKFFRRAIPSLSLPTWVKSILAIGTAGILLSAIEIYKINAATLVSFAECERNSPESLVNMLLCVMKSTCRTYLNLKQWTKFKEIKPDNIYMCTLVVAWFVHFRKTKKCLLF